jgi:hypothetical protein
MGSGSHSDRALDIRNEISFSSGPVTPTSVYGTSDLSKATSSTQIIIILADQSGHAVQVMDCVRPLKDRCSGLEF